MRDVYGHEDVDAASSIDWKSLTPEEAAVRIDVLEMVGEANLIEFTHWTPEQIDAVDESRLNRLRSVLAYRARAQKKS